MGREKLAESAQQYHRQAVSRQDALGSCQPKAMQAASRSTRLRFLFRYYDFRYHHGLLVSPGLSYFHAVQSNTLHIIGVHKSQACYCDTLLNRRPTPRFLTSVSSAYCLELHTGRLLSGQPLSQQRGDSSGPATQASRSQSIFLTRSDQRGLLGLELMLDPNIYMKTGHSNSYL